MTIAHPGPSTSAAQKVFDLPELYEMILLNLSTHEILQNLHNDPKMIQAVKASKNLQRKLFLTQEPEIDVVDRDPAEFPHSAAVWEPNIIFFSEHSLSSRDLWSYDSPWTKQNYFKLNEDGPEYWLELSPRLPGETGSPWSFTLTRFEKPEPQHPPIPTIPPAWLSMNLSDRATPISMHLENYAEVTTWKPWEFGDDDDEDEDTKTGYEAHLYGTKNIWVPAGATLGDIIHWYKVNLAGGMSRADVMNGICQFKWSVLTDPNDEIWVRKLGWWVLHVSGEWRPPLSKGRGWGPDEECREMEAMRNDEVEKY
ncbi:hypothetical protein M409DRAFT_54074 [Zasmidium cellare ATCC 36951]|uniref:Uncharacterized protein n=1 Tax=Zasmidium cellare ATCC 36951 TaxID=1080233 RepID=A0A6A6CJZ2_ZASCE|nr:uncharacterized protein M409DRAFT_54074 [Zasmidium cellare ATCC 36951]KAF2167475.1 hypothetical protein M409DRAFT_54074 [Zasmidium cellare ATCC 36951]